MQQRQKLPHRPRHRIRHSRRQMQEHRRRKRSLLNLRKGRRRSRSQLIGIQDIGNREQAGYCQA